VIALLASLALALATPPAAHHAAKPAERDVTSEALTPAGEFDLAERHYARGEYRQAADHFTLAAARLDPGSKTRAHYGAGLSWLGAGESTRARAEFEDAAEPGGPEAPLARLGIALSWEAERRADRAEDALASLVQGEMGEAGPTALAHLATLAHARGDRDRERRARDRLAREYPASMEAAEAQLAASPAAAADTWVQIGAFADAANAEALAERARRAGFGDMTIRRAGAEQEALTVVLIGPLRSDDEARRTLAQASERLGVTARIVRPQ